MSDTPINAYTRIEYKGYNVTFLEMARAQHGYVSNEWATFLDHAKHGYSVKKGEKSVHCRTFIEDENKKSTAVKYFCLFNREQVEETKTKEVPASEFTHAGLVTA